MARTLLLGLDSMTFTLLDDLVAEGRLPFLGRCLEEGVRADLISTPNPITPLAWPTLMTGMNPGAHGIFDFMHWTEYEHGPWGRLVTSNDVRCETIVSMANRHGRRVIQLNFPATFPAKPVNGFVVPGYILARQLRTSVYPRDLYHRLIALPGFDPKEFSWNMDLNRKAVDGVPAEEYERWVGYITNKDQHWYQVAKMLITEEQWDFAAIVFEGVDRLQHLCWRFLDPDLKDTLKTPWEKRVRDLSIDYFVRLDGYLASLVEIAGQETRVFLASDHGAGPTTEIVFANAFLAERGHLVWKSAMPPNPDDQLTAPYIFDFYKTVDWPRTRAYVRSSSANGVYIRKAERGWGGVTKEEYPSYRAKLVEELLSWRDPATNDTVIKRAVIREEAYPGPAMEDAPDITLYLRDGGHPSILPSDQLVKPRRQVSGMHRHEGIFMAMGPGIRRGATLPSRAIADTAPTLLYSLGLPLPAGLEGKLIEETWEPGLLEREPVRVEESAGPARSGAGAPVDEEMSQEDEAKVIERLRHLGYLD